MQAVGKVKQCGLRKIFLIATCWKDKTMVNIDMPKKEVNIVLVSYNNNPESIVNKTAFKNKNELCVRYISVDKQKGKFLQ